MNQLPSTDIDGWVHREIQGEVVETGGFHDGPSIPFVVPAKSDLPPSRLTLVQVSPNHARSFETVPTTADRALGRLAVWHDAYGNGFTGYSLKGNNLSDPKIIKTTTAANGFIPNGLQDSAALLRVIRGSRLLRENGIDTEWIDRIYEPKYLYHSGEPVSQDEYKRRLMDAYDGEDRDKAEHALDQSRFFVTGRSMNVNDRLWDFTTDTRESARARFRHVFAAYNSLHTSDPNYEPLDHESDADRLRYLTDVFPYLATRSLARIHNMGMAHVFPYIGNVTALGAVVDLDSLTGEPLGFGDDAAGIDERVRDVYEFSSFGHDLTDKYYNRLYRHLAGLGLASHKEYVETLDSIGRYYEEHTAATRTEPIPKREEIMLAPIASSHWHRINNGLLETVGHERFEPYLMNSINKIEQKVMEGLSGEQMFFTLITRIDRLMERDCVPGLAEMPASLSEELDDDGAYWIEKMLMLDDDVLTGIADETLADAGLENTVFALATDQDRRQLFAYLSQFGFWKIWKDHKFGSDGGKEGLAMLGDAMSGVVGTEAAFIKEHFKDITANYIEMIAGYDTVKDSLTINSDTFHRLRRLGISFASPDVLKRIADELDVTLVIHDEALVPSDPPVIAGQACPRLILTDTTRFRARSVPHNDDFVALQVTELSDDTTYCAWISELLTDEARPTLHVIGTPEFEEAFKEKRPPRA